MIDKNINTWCLFKEWDKQSGTKHKELFFLIISYKKVKFIQQKRPHVIYNFFFWEQNFACAISVKGLVPIWHQTYVWNFDDLFSDYCMLKKNKCHVMLTDIFLLSLYLR